jgi:RNA polymerase sigma-70 factor (ECF subfamily)
MLPAPKRLRLVEPEVPVPAEPAELTDTELYLRFSPYVAGIGFRLLGRNSEVDDLVQEVFFAAFKQRAQLRDLNAARSWLAVITVRKARERLRMRRLRQFVGLDSCSPLELTHQAIPADDLALLTRVYEILDRVNVDCRLAWILRYVEGERLEQVAERCGCSLATAKRRIAAAQAYLQAEMGDG